MSRRPRLWLLLLGSTLLVSSSVGAQRTLPLDLTLLERLLRLRPLPPLGQDVGYRLLDRMIDSARLRPIDSTSSLLPKLLLGADFALAPRLKLSIDGALNTLVDYNGHDGLWLGYETQLSWSIASGQKLMLRSSNNVTLRSRLWLHEHHLLYYFAPQYSGMLLLSLGHTTRETAFLTPTERLSDDYTGLIGTNSPVRHYLKDFAALRTRLSGREGRWRLSWLGLYEQRQSRLSSYAAHRSLLYELDLSYRLGEYSSEIKPYEWDGRPILRPYGYRGLQLGLRLRQAYAPSGARYEYSDYTLLEGSLRSVLPLGRQSHLSAQLTGGRFLTRRRLYDADLRYFASVGLGDRRPISSTWVTLPESFASGQSWLTLGLSLTCEHLLVSSRSSWGQYLDEALHLRSAHTERGGYSEAGYSIGLGELARLGLFVGADWQTGTPRLGLGLSLPIIALLSTWSERY